MAQHMGFSQNESVWVYGESVVPHPGPSQKIEKAK